MLTRESILSFSLRPVRKGGGRAAWRRHGGRKSKPDRQGWTEWYADLHDGQRWRKISLEEVPGTLSGVVKAAEGRAGR